MILMRYFVEREYDINPSLQYDICDHYCAARGVSVVGGFNDGAHNVKSELSALRTVATMAIEHRADIVTLDSTWLMSHTPKYRRLKKDLAAAGVAVITLGVPDRKQVSYIASCRPDEPTSPPPAEREDARAAVLGP